MGGYFALFAVGAILAEIKAAGLNRLRAAGLAAGVVVAVNWGVTAADMQADETGVPFSHSVVIVLHLIAIALVALPLVPAISRLSIPGSRMAGALTYPLYLVHAFIGYIVMSQIARVAPDWVAYVVTIAFVVLLAWLLHKFVEEGCASLWKRHADRYVRQPIEAIELRWQHRRDRSQRVIAPAWNEGEAGGA
jgi:peptidoglycan/LPS O-acetylase OafA/YrhL